MAGAKGPKGETPTWALVLESIGWLIAGIGVVIAAAALMPVLRHPDADGLGVLLPMAFGVGSAAYWFGGVPIAVARAARRGVPLPRWRLWASIVMRVGAIFSISTPCWMFGVLSVGSQVALLMGDASSGAPSLYGSQMIQAMLLLAGPPFLLGLAFIVPALIWGRRKSAPDIPAVFT